MRNKPTYQDLENQITELKRQNEVLRLKKNPTNFSADKYSKMIGNIGDVIVIINGEGLNEYKSPNIEKFFGWKLEDVVGKNTFDNVHPEDLEFAQNFIEKIIREPGIVRTTELRYKCKDGSYKWIEFTCCNLLHDPDINGLLGNYRDITQRKQAEDSLRINAEKYHAIFNNVIDTYYESSIDGKILEISPSIKFTSKGQYTAADLIGKSMYEIYNDASEREVLISLLKKEGIVSDFEITLKNKDGSLVPCSISSKIILDSHGQASKIIGSLRDITERKRFEAELITARKRAEESESRFRALYNASFGGICVHDKGIILECNLGLSTMSGYSIEELIGMNGLLLIAERSRKHVMDKILSGYEKPYEAFGVHKNGHEFPMRLEARNIPYKGNMVRTVEFRDITEQKKAELEIIKSKEKAEESDRLKSAFLANMSHEIRTPMNGIIGFANLLKEPGLKSEQQQEYLDIIEKSGARMLNIINDIVSISKIESNQMEVNIKESNINMQMEYIYSFFKPEVEGKGMLFSYQNSLPSEDAIIKTDREKVYAILTNLVKNAIKYSDKGSIEFGYIKKGKFIEFYVKDTGVGIPKNRQKAIFDRFVQADISDKKAYQGAGLGLSISKAFVEMLGGKIWVESEVGEGSIFYFSLPYIVEKKEISNSESSILIPSEENSLKRFKTLIVEDDETSEKLISIAVQKHSNEIISVRTGAEAVEACRNNPDIDMVFMDIQLPEMNGYEATSQIRQFNKNVIIIAQTAYALEGDKEKAVAAGCNDYLSKPIKINEVKELFNKYLSK